MAYSIVEELKPPVKVLNKKNQSRTDLINDFTTARLLNVETSQTNTRSASPTDASYLIKTTATKTTTPISTVTTIEDDTSTTNNICMQQLTNFSFNGELINQNLDNIKNSLKLEETKKYNMIEKESEKFNTMMDIDNDEFNAMVYINGDDSIGIDPKNAIPFDIPPSPSSSNIFDEVYSIHQYPYDPVNAINNCIDDNSSIFYNDDTIITNDFIRTIPSTTETSVLVKDEELTTLDCINPRNVHAFSYDVENSITPISPIMKDIEMNAGVDQDFDYNLILNNNYNISNNNSNSNSNSNNNNNNYINNNLNFGDGNITASNNIMNKFASCNNTYSKKKAQALKLKIDLQCSSNEKPIETPDVIQIVASLEAQNEKENLFPSDVLSKKTINEDSSSCIDSFEYSSPRESPELDVGTQEIDTKLLSYQSLLSPCDSAISNCTSGINNLSSPLSVGGLSDNSYSDDANLSVLTSYLSSPPPTPASQISQTYSEYSTIQTAQNTRNQKLKKKRGRPALNHSSPPSYEQLKSADSNKRKYLEQRYKNNEASRISRRNRKLKEDEEKDEEQSEIKRNAILKAKHAKLTMKHEFLKEYLRNIVSKS